MSGKEEMGTEEEKRKEDKKKKNLEFHMRLTARRALGRR